MAISTKSDSFQIGRVTCYRHHGAWWIRWSDHDEAVRAPDGRACLRRQRVGRSRLESEDFGALTREVLDVADDYAGGRVVSVLEGGYDPQALRDSIVVHLEALIG